jgi:hypothetical protein
MFLRRSLSDLAQEGRAEMTEVMEVLAQVLVAARALLFILDTLDNHVPKLKRVTDILGTLLGGRKERFGGE